MGNAHSVVLVGKNHVCGAERATTFVVVDDDLLDLAFLDKDALFWGMGDLKVRGLDGKRKGEKERKREKRQDTSTWDSVRPV